VELVKSKFGDEGGLGVREALREQVDLEDRRRKQEATEDKTAQRFLSIREYAPRIPEARHGPVDLEQFPFQILPFYDDTIALAREAVYKKSTQVGASTGSWRWAIHRADQFGERVIYFFPTDVHVTDFNDQRIDPSIEASEYLRSRIPQGRVRRKTLKQIGLGDISLRGMQSKNSVQSVDADALVIDEYDECEPRRISEAEQRLSGAKAAGREPRIRRLGRPSVPGYGIDKEYDRSDQRQWEVECPDCGERQGLDWLKNVRWKTRAGGDVVMQPGHDEAEDVDDVTIAWRVCAHCEASLEPRDGSEFGPIHAGVWTPQSPAEGRIPGFWLQRLIVPRTDLEQMVRNSRKTKPAEIETFWNADLGLAFAPSDAYLTDTHLDRACSAEDALEECLEEYTGYYPIIAGLDAASERHLNMRVSEVMPDGRRRAIWIGAPENFEKAAELMHRLQIAALVVDSQPERRLARALATEFPGRVFLCRYDEKPEADAIRYDPEKNIVTVNRTEAIDAMMDAYREGHTLGLRREPATWRAQMKSMKRQLQEDSKGRPVKRYVSTSSLGDDYAHAETFEVVASEMLNLLEMAGARTEEAEPMALTEEQLGYRRTPLTGLSDRYVPGLGEGEV
jgi:hypothetical protein